MNITIITQDDKFYLYEPLKFLINDLRSLDIKLSIIMVDAGLKKTSNKTKERLRILKIFGWKFCAHYFIKLVWRSFRRKSIINLCQELVQPATFVQDVNDPKLIARLREEKTDLIVSVTCNQIFKKDLLNSATIGVLNLHTSKLPLYRGVMPTFWALKNGEDSIGVSVFWVDEGIDTGPLASSEIVNITQRKQSALIQTTKKIGVEMLAKVIRDVYAGTIVRIPQSSDENSYYGFPTRADVEEFMKRNSFY